MLDGVGGAGGQRRKGCPAQGARSKKYSSERGSLLVMTWYLLRPCGHIHEYGPRGVQSSTPSACMMSPPEFLRGIQQLCYYYPLRFTPEDLATERSIMT